MAGEVYKILDLDIDYNKLVTSTAEAKKRLADMTSELRAMRLEGKGTTEEAVKLEAEMKALGNEVRVNTKILTDATAANNANEGSVEKLRRQLSAVSAQWAQLSQDERENTVLGQALGEQKLELTNRLKTLEAATGDNRRNVGNYTQSIVEAAKGMGIFSGTFGGAISKLNDAKEALNIVKQGFDMSSISVTGFGKALIATGIGIIVLLLGALINGLSKLDPVMDKIAQLTAGFGAAMDVVTTTAVKFIENIKSVGDLMSKLGSIISNPTKAYKELTTSMLDAAKAAADLKEQQQQLEDAMQVQEVITARVNQQVRELILQSKNRSTSEAERQALLAKAAKLDEEDFQRRTRLANSELAIAENAAKIKGQLSDAEMKKLREVGVEYAVQLMNRGLLNQEEVDALKKAQIDKIALLDESTARQEKIQNQSDALEEKRVAKLEAMRKAAADAEQKRAQELAKQQEKIMQDLQDQLDLLDAIAGKNKNTNELGTIYRQQLALLNAKLEQEKITETKYKAELKKLQDDYFDAIESRLKGLSEKSEKNRKEVFDKEQQALNARIANEDSAAAKAQSDRDKKREAYIIDLENEMELRRLQGENLYNLRVEQLNREREAEVLAAEKVGADTAKIQQKYELIMLQIKKEAQRAQLATLADGLGVVADLLGKNTVAGKAAGIAQATINTYLGVSQVLAAPPSGPEPFNTITKAVSIATTIGTGLKNVAEIVKVPTKFESGGKAITAGGNLHAFGGTKYYGEDGNIIEVERGENMYVLNRRASREINALSALNTYYGGADFSTPISGGYFADGGMVSRSMDMPDINPQVAVMIADAISNIRPVVDVKDVITGVNNRVELVDKSNI